jgi:DNA-binding IclR family transcriptional regulator
LRNETQGGQIVPGKKIKESERHVEALLKGLEILDCVEQHQPVSLLRLTNYLDINKSRAIRLCGTLEHLGYLLRDSNKQYSLGHRVLSLGHTYERKSPIVYVIRPHMEDLSRKSGLAASFYVLSGRSVVCLARIGGNKYLSPESLDSSTRELHFGASGKIFLAFGKSSLREAYFSSQDDRYPQLTPHTITSPQALWEKLNQVKKDGYCISLEERVIGSGGIGAPVFTRLGELAGVTTLAGSAADFAPEKQENLVSLILAGAKEISKDLAY